MTLQCVQSMPNFPWPDSFVDSCSMEINVWLKLYAEENLTKKFLAIPGVWLPLAAGYKEGKRSPVSDRCSHSYIKLLN